MNNKNKQVITCKNIIFYSRNDEEALSEWLNKIKSIVNLSLIYDELQLEFKNAIIPDQDLRDILAIFNRYKIKNISQLKVFLNEKNKEWFFENKKAFWYKKIFGKNL